MTAARAVLDRARAAGLRLRLRPDGGLRVEADAPPPPELLAELRERRHDIARLLAAQDIPSDAGGLVGDDDERQAMLAHYSAEPRDRVYRPDIPDPYTAGLLTAALMRPPSWSGSTPPPPKGAWCSCCGRSHRSGGRWWRPRNPRSDGLGLGQGWRCMVCHPPPAGSDIEEVRT